MIISAFNMGGIGLERLETIAELLRPGQPVADIGADHALLSIYLVDRQIAPGVIATELGEGPYQRLCRAVDSSPYADRIVVRQGDGLQPVEPGEVNNIVIAGLGGDTLVQILSYDWDKASSFDSFVFQPMSRPGALRLALARQGWQLRSEKLVWQNQHFFSIIMAVPGSHPYNLSPLELDAGPILLRQTSPVAQAYRWQLWKSYQRMRSNLLLSKTSRSQELLQDVEDKLKELEVHLR
jgi:tRNA (adenine22-N1)-methyltransferase